MKPVDTITDVQDQKLLMEHSVPGRRGVRLPPLDVPEQPLPDSSLLRDELPLPELSQPEVVRYFTRLSQLNYSVDTHFYPLGSCTMKYNPKVNDQIASLPGMASLHPLAPEESSQGALKVMHRLQGYLSDISGMAATSLATMAGAQGELSGVLMIRAYHLEHGQAQRRTRLIPDRAHRTNPASAARGGRRGARCGRGGGPGRPRPSHGRGRTTRNKASRGPGYRRG